MKEQKSINRILYAIVLIVIIAGIVVASIKGFNIELQYLSRNSIVLSNNTSIDKSKVEEIAKSILTDRKVGVNKIENFENAVEITATQITEDEKNQIITKFNEEYGSNITNEEIEIEQIPNTRIRDILKPYIFPGIISLVIVLAYFIFRYHKIGLKKVILKTICMPVILEITFYALIAILKIPFGNITNAIAIGIYILSLIYVTNVFEKQREKLPKEQKKEND